MDGEAAALPADGHRQRLRGAGTRTDDLGPQPSGLEDIEERVTGGYGPCVRQREPWGNWTAGREGPTAHELQGVVTSGASRGRGAASKENTMRLETTSR